MVKPETRVQFLGQEDPLEKEMATHSSTLAWKIPWTEEPGRIQSMRLQRVRRDWATSLLTLRVTRLILSLFLPWYSWKRNPTPPWSLPAPPTLPDRLDWKVLPAFFPLPCGDAIQMSQGWLMDASDKVSSVQARHHAVRTKLVWRQIAREPVQ